MPCPFCGREQHNPLEAGHADDCYFTLHDKLKREMEESNCYSVPDVLAAWNRRAIPEKQPLAQAPAVAPEKTPAGYNRPPSGEPCNTDDFNAGYEAGLADGKASHAVVENDPAGFEVWEGDELFASTSGPRAQAWAEILRYADQCYGAGIVRVFEVSRIERTVDESYVPVQPMGGVEP